MSPLSFSSKTVWHPCKPLMSLHCSVVTLDTEGKSPIRSLDSDQPWWQDWWLNKTRKRPDIFGLIRPRSPNDNTCTYINTHTHFPPPALSWHTSGRKAAGRFKFDWQAAIFLSRGCQGYFPFPLTACMKFKIKRRQTDPHGPTERCDFIIKAQDQKEQSREYSMLKKLYQKSFIFWQTPLWIHSTLILEFWDKTGNNTWKKIKVCVKRIFSEVFTCV